MMPVNRETLRELSIGQEIILICKLLLHWNVLKPFLLNSLCLNWLNDWYLVLGNKHCRVRPLWEATLILAFKQKLQQDVKLQNQCHQKTWIFKRNLRMEPVSVHQSKNYLPLRWTNSNFRAEFSGCILGVRRLSTQSRTSTRTLATWCLIFSNHSVPALIRLALPKADSESRPRIFWVSHH